MRAVSPNSEIQVLMPQHVSGSLPEAFRISEQRLYGLLRSFTVEFFINVMPITISNEIRSMALRQKRRRYVKEAPR